MIKHYFGNFHLLVEADEQARRAADAGWETARWTFWLTIGTFLLVAGAVAAAIFAWKTWTATRDQLTNSNEQLAMARQAEKQSEASNVSAWPQMETNGDISITIRNGNGGPVYDVTCQVLAKLSPLIPLPSDVIHRWHMVALLPSASLLSRDVSFTVYAADHANASTDHSGTRRTQDPSTPATMDTAKSWRLWDGDPDSTGLSLNLNFRDSSGVRWQRDWNGCLTQQDK